MVEAERESPHVLCVIPVRGGSKGIPGKNLRLIGGKPLVVWTIEQALACHPPVHVIVSTDDAEIAAVATAAGAHVPFLRPAALATDAAATEPVVEHALAWWRTQHEDPDAVMLLQATSPIRLPGTLDRALAQFAGNQFDSLVGVVPQSLFVWTAGPPPTPGYDVDRRPRRQDIPADQVRYRETGSLYLTRPAVYDTLHNRLGGRIGLFIMDEIEGTDIDIEPDLLLAAAIIDSLPTTTEEAQ